MFVLRAEGCFRYPSAVLQFVLSRMIKRLAENDKKFGAERFVGPLLRQVNDYDPFIIQYLNFFFTIFYHLTLIFKYFFWKTLVWECEE